MSHYCQTPRPGMYVRNSTCGHYAAYMDETDGKPVCEPHARYAVRAGHKVTPPIECADCPPTDPHRIPCIECPRRSGFPTGADGG